MWISAASGESSDGRPLSLRDSAKPLTTSSSDPGRHTQQQQHTACWSTQPRLASLRGDGDSASTAEASSPSPSSSSTRRGAAACHSAVLPP